MYGAPITSAPSTRYLGMIMSPQGVEMTASLQPCIQKAKNSIRFLQVRGLNGWEWRPPISLMMYKTF
ncbi:hypothetical protein HK096_010539, partial [Nowakowskiella sp. JEL0078]